MVEAGYEIIEGDKLDTVFKKFDAENKGIFIFQFTKSDEFIGGILLSELEFETIVSSNWTKPKY